MTEDLERSITEKVTTAALEAVGKLDLGDGDKRSIVIVPVVVVFSNIGSINGC